MLVISRKPGEKLRIGDNIEIAILDISGSRVVLGLEAPREIPIRRIGASHAADDLERGNDSMAPASGPTREPIEPIEAAETSASRPFEYPSRAQPEHPDRPSRKPVVTVKRSRRVASLPPDTGVG